MKKFLLFFIFCSFLAAEEIVEKKLDIEYIKSLEKGNERDFYINEYLKQDITSQQAYETLFYIDNMKKELFFNFAKKFNDDETLGVAQCMNMSSKELVNSYADCFVVGLSIKDLSQLSAIDFDLLKQKSEGKYKDFRKALKVLSAPIPFTKLILLKDDEFYNIYFNVTEEFRTKYFNYKLTKKAFERIFSNKKMFNKFLQVSLTNNKLNTLNKSLNGLDDTDLNFNSSFLLALNAIRLKDDELALKYLNNAALKTSSQKETDKIKFWQYQITKDENILKELSQSAELNFYTYLALEKLGIKIDYSNNLFRIDYFDDLLETMDKKRVALIYSLAKIKSNFDVNKISDDFRVGIMQLNPNLIKSISDIIGDEYNIFKLFEVETNIKYTNIYLDSIEQKYNNPLSISLAYDGFKKSFNFSNDLKDITMEPYFTMELILNKYQEDKKEFLLNYILYSNALIKDKKEQLSLQTICEMLLPNSHKQDE